MTETIVLDTPAQIQYWVWTSRMHQIALQLVSGLKPRGGPILAAMYREGLIDEKLRGTRDNLQIVLRAMVDQTMQLNPSWKPGPQIIRALELTD